MTFDVIYLKPSTKCEFYGHCMTLDTFFALSQQDTTQNSATRLGLRSRSLLFTYFQQHQDVTKLTSPPSLLFLTSTQLQIIRKFLIAPSTKNFLTFNSLSTVPTDEVSFKEQK